MKRKTKLTPEVELPKTMSAKSYAKHIGVALSTVNGWLRENKIEGAERKEFEGLVVWSIPVNAKRPPKRDKGRPFGSKTVNRKAKPATKAAPAKPAKKGKR
jgi:hypothetical protein